MTQNMGFLRVFLRVEKSEMGQLAFWERLFKKMS